MQHDRPPHQPHQSPGNRQAQTGTAKTARGRILGLGERLEQSRLHLRVDADAVIAHHQIQPGPPVFLRGRYPVKPHADLADALRIVPGELDGIAAQIEQNLAQAHRIAKQVLRYGRRHLDEKAQLPLRGLG